ncbi:MAG: hypothetical protein AAF401_15815 [Pseudomonadota bacterium]
MTALAKYDLLEAEGRYIAAEGAAAQEVIVKFGDASLMILDLGDNPVAHWPLATLRDVGAEEGLLLTPDHGGVERLTVADAEMTAAIKAVCPDLRGEAPAPRRRWLRWAVRGVVTCALIYGAIFHAAPFVFDRMIASIPKEAEQAMGEAIERTLGRSLGGGVCRNSDGAAALASMVARLTVQGDAQPVVAVIEAPLTRSVALPGGRIVLPSGLIAAAVSPEAAAGAIARAIGVNASKRPLRQAMEAAGVNGGLGLLLGDFGAGDVRTMAQAMLADQPTKDDIAYAAARLAQTGLPSSPYAAFLDAEAPALAPFAKMLRDSDEIGDQSFEPALSDQQWVALQGICE